MCVKCICMRACANRSGYACMCAEAPGRENVCSRVIGEAAGIALDRWFSRLAHWLVLSCGVAEIARQVGDVLHVVLACVVMAYVVMAYIVMAYRVIAYGVMPYIVMALSYGVAEIAWQVAEYLANGNDKANGNSTVRSVLHCVFAVTAVSVAVPLFLCCRVRVLKKLLKASKMYYHTASISLNRIAHLLIRGQRC